MINLNYTLIIQLAIVLGLMVILSHLAFKPFLKILQARQSYLEDAEQKAAELQRRAQELMEQYRETMAAAQAQGTALRDEIRKEGLAAEAEIIQKTTEEAHQILREIQIKISNEIEIARAEFQSQAQSLSREMAQKILGRELS